VRFDTVLELEESPHLCASAGRFAGTLEAQYPWVFYIDGDMEIRNEFFDIVANINKLGPAFAGIIGVYVHKFDNGTVATQSFSRSINFPAAASQFGGAVILRREAVLKAGNWDPCIYGKEEMELYVRLGGGKLVVCFVNVPMIDHYSEYYSRVELVMRLLTPSAGLGKVFWGYGQSLRALTIKSRLTAMLKLEYEAYYFWIALLVVFAIGAFYSIPVAVILMLTVAVGFSLWLRPGSIIRYMTLPLSLIPGWFRYFPWFRPKLIKWGSSEKTAS